MASPPCFSKREAITRVYGGGCAARPRGSIACVPFKVDEEVSRFRRVDLVTIDCASKSIVSPLCTQEGEKEDAGLTARDGRERDDCAPDPGGAEDG